MAWSDIAWIVVICTSMNHLELIKTIEGLLKKEIPVVNCPKCATFWASLAWCLIGRCITATSIADILAELPQILAVSFLAAYAAIWLELIMYSIDTIYNRIYGTLSKYNPEESEGDDENGQG